MNAGIVYGVGVGPGDPSLLTVRAAEILRLVDAVVAPVAAEGRRSLALEIARPYITPGCRLITPVLPMTEDSEVLTDSWRNAAELLAGEARAGGGAAFVTLGDPMLYSTWGYVAGALMSIAPEIRRETVPGVMAMAACAASAGVPLAQGREPLLIWPDEPSILQRTALSTVPNVVFMKAARHMEQLAELAEDSGRTAVAVRSVGRPGEALTHDLLSWVGQTDYFTTVLMRRPVEQEGEGR